MANSGGGCSIEAEGRVRYPEIDTYSETGSSRAAMEEPRRRLGVEYNKIFVAVGKEVKESKSLLIWALQNSRGKKICIVYVKVPAQMIPMPMGGKFPLNQVVETELRAFRESERLEMVKIIDDYLHICSQVGVCGESIYMDANSIEEGIVDLISQHGIGRLVMGAAADSRYSRKMVEPKSKKANYVRQHAPDFCHIWFVCKARLIYTREGVKQSSPDGEIRPSAALENIQSVPGALSQELSSRLRLSNFSGYEGSSEELDQSSPVSFSRSSTHSPETHSAFSSPCSSFARERKESRMELMDLPQSPISHHISSPPSVLQESSMNGDVYDQLEHVMLEAEKSRREAFEESIRRRKAEKEAMEAIRKAKVAERLYNEELRLRKEAEEELAKGKQDLEETKSLRDKVSHELHEALDQKKSLESQINELDVTVKEMEQKILSAVELLQKYKDEREEFQIERDKALQEAVCIRKQLAEGSSCSYTPMFFSVFSFSDLDNATNQFDPSLKIGEGGYGSIYRGFLRHTEVAIKILNPSSLQGPQEFQQEVDVLSKLRHPNLVTLIGACPESWALIYEYLHGGSLEDRLNCEDNTPPLTWQTRIRIAAELCSVLIFLHSSKPSSIIHGDLKPSNILLDNNFVCKLSDFGICRLISSGKISNEQATKFFLTEPKGTFSYIDPGFLTTGELTTMSDVYSFGVILLRLLTGRPALGISKEVQSAVDNGNLNSILDPSAGDWPFIQAEQLTHLALRCCDMNRKNRPDLQSEVCRVLKPMKASCRSLSTLRRVGDDQAPFYFICPIFQEIMQDPHIAADGFTYEAEAIRGWLDSDHDTSPMTNMPLENHTLVPNRALRSAIQEWLQKNCIV